MSKKTLEITESDEAGNVTATYVQSTVNQEGESRVDIILPTNPKTPWQRLLDVFLPAGYPHSVTDDYLEYQIYDSLQAFSSSIASLLSSRAVLSSVGVGDSSASPTAALLLSILQETAGRIATILFAHRFGTSLEPERKMYRLLADVLNDIAFVLDCLSPAFPKPMRVLILSFSSILRALCGVAAGSAKASLSAHFAKWGNLGELNAKDSSQETVISLLGMLVGSVVVSWVTTPIATWTTLILLLSIHLETNRRAVRAVKMRTMNRQRASLVYHQLSNRHVPTPTEIARQELIFEWDGVLREAHGKAVGYCTIGAPMSVLIKLLATLQHSATKASILKQDMLNEVLTVFEDSNYLLWFDNSRYPSNLIIVIKQLASPADLLCAWWHALELARVLYAICKSTDLYSQPHEQIELLKFTKKSSEAMFEEYNEKLKEKGWEIDQGALEIPSSSRISINR